MLQFISYQLFRFFSSLKLAVFTIVLLASSLAAGTIIESLHGAQIARDSVYHARWFAFILTMLSINVACAALSRLPWKRRHTGFVITHTGIILILAGSLLTLAYGKNGQMAVRVDQTSNLVLLDHQFLHLQVPGKGIDALFPVNPRKNKSRHLPLAPWSPVSARIVEVIPKAKSVSRILDDDRGAPGVLLRITGMMGEMKEWLVYGDPVREHLNVGPAEILLLYATSEEELNFLMNDLAPEKTSDKKFKFPESGRNALYVIMAPQGKLYYRLKARGVFTQKGPLFKGVDYRTGWMDYKFSVEDYRSNVVVDREYEPVSRGEEREDNPSAIHILVERKRDVKSVWLEINEKKTIEIEGLPVRLNFLLERESLPFSLKLLKFDIARYEGTDNPMSYESQVEVNDPAKQKTFTREIKMNRPLKLRGYTVYQAAFQEEEGVPVASVFAVAKDPGIAIKYLGSIILVMGIGIQFFGRRWLTRERVKHVTTTTSASFNTVTRDKVKSEEVELVENVKK
ncbi:MAG: cytochrome c biogenesis protein ResB [Candidatus Omnitrophica bacterium]|nr:cytochrome c biogenesis protein ResB [Candidatus Omnitrophota bacterium]